MRPKYHPTEDFRLNVGATQSISGNSLCIEVSVVGAERVDERALTRTPSKRIFFCNVIRRKHSPAARRMVPASAVWETSVKSRVTVWKLSNRSLMPMVRPM